jgi:hypothetical protein
MLRAMDHSDPLFPMLPGWRFSLTETSANVYRAEGHHIDGRSVSRMGSEVELAALIRDTVEDARNLSERRRV